MDSKTTNEFTEWYKNKFYPEAYMSYALDNFFTCVYIIQEYCEAHNIPYLFSQAIDLIIYLNYKHKAIAADYFINHYLENKINEKNFVGWPLFSEMGGYNICEKVDNTKYAIGELDHHPNDLGYKMIADILWKEWKGGYP